MSAFWDSPLMLQGVLAEEAAKDMCRAFLGAARILGQVRGLGGSGGKWPPRFGGLGRARA